MLAKQYFRMTRCESKVDVIITDSPLLLSLIYNTNKERLGENFDKLVIHLFNNYNNMNYFINRVKPYNPIGRLQTEEESNQLSIKIKSIFNSAGCDMIDINGDTNGYNKVVEDVISKLVNKETNV